MNNQQTFFAAVAILVFLLFLVYGLHIHDDNKKITKAARLLQIPHQHIEYLKHYLLTLYKHNPTLYRFNDEAFLQYIHSQEHHLLHLINRKLNHLSQVDKMIEDDHYIKKNSLNVPFITGCF